MKFKTYTVKVLVAKTIRLRPKQRRLEKVSTIMKGTCNH